jgi:hypothetical protein
MNSAAWTAGQALPDQAFAKEGPFKIAETSTIDLTSICRPGDRSGFHHWFWVSFTGSPIPVWHQWSRVCQPSLLNGSGGLLLNDDAHTAIGHQVGAYDVIAPGEE